MKAGRPSPIGRGSVRADSCQDPSVMRSSMKTNQTLASPFTLKVNLSVESASCTAMTAGSPPSISHSATSSEVLMGEGVELWSMMFPFVGWAVCVACAVTKTTVHDRPYVVNPYHEKR